MKKSHKAIIVTAAFISSGCVQTIYNSSIAVTKDEHGKIIQTVETESVSQPGQGWPLKLKILKDVQP
ncbi:MAG: hypothetical protein Q8S55_22830 [Methylococcaceae bacterium]|nr:hypothetical protein [Methylococcaceae bacterium]